MSDTRTMPACPPWCAKPEGHGWESDAGGVTRMHTREFYEDEALNVQVSIDSVESAEWGHKGLARTSVDVCLYADGNSLDGPRARQVAAALLNAAEAWDAAQATS